MTSDERESNDPLLRAVAASPKALVPGVTVLGGRFRLARRLGVGGFGVVFEAEDLRDGGRIALKWLKQPEADWLYRFKREFRALQGISHPGLVTKGDLLCDGEEWYFTMELVDGVDFVSHVRSVAGGFEEQKLRDALCQLFGALAALHAVERVHRDIKPSNVLVSRQGRVVLIDFGLVTEPFHGTESAAVGTPAYMAPEQAASQEVGPPADVYAVGVMLYEVLTGRLPIEGPPLQVLVEKQTRQPPSPRSIVASVPSDLDALCLRCLHFEPARRPSAEAALQALARGQDPGLGARGWTDAARFVGRAAELAIFREAFASSVDAGRPGTVLVSGESGIGKSRLVRHFTSGLLAERPDVLLLAGRCHERETIPYKTLDAVIDALSRRLAGLPPGEVAALLSGRSLLLSRLFPVLLRLSPFAGDHASAGADPPPEGELRQRAFRELRDLFGKIARRHPTVVVIDDLQWADDDGLKALAETLRPPGAPPLLFIGMVRTGREPRIPERLGAAVPEDRRILELTGLRMHEAEELAAAHLQRAGVSGADGRWIATETQGHPLFVEELARRAAQRAPGAFELRLDEAIRARIDDLEARTREVADLVAIAGKPAPRLVVAAAAGLDGADFLRRIAVLRSSNLVRTTASGSVSDRPESLEPYHDRVGEALLARLEPSRRRSLHQALALAFEASSPRDSEALAMHWREAGNLQRAASFAEMAGDQAFRTLAFDRATTWFEQALDLLPESRAGRRELRIKLGDALAHSGRGALAAAQFEIAAADAPPLEALDLRRRTAEQLLRSGHFDRGIEVSRAVLGEIGMRIPRTRVQTLAALVSLGLRLRLRLLRWRRLESRPVSPQVRMRIDVCRSIAGGLTFVETFVGFLFLRRALLWALSSGDLERIVPLLGMEAAFVATAGGRAWRRTGRLLGRTRELAARSGSPQARTFAIATSGIASYLNGRFRDAADQLRQTLNMLQDSSMGLVHEGVTARIFGIQALAFLGSFRELGLWQAEGLREAVARGDIYAKVNLRVGLPNLAWLVNDQPDLAESEVRAAMGEWSTQGFHNEHCYALLARVTIALYRSDPAAAHALAEELAFRTRRSLFWRIQTIRLRVLYACGASALALAERTTDREALLRTALRAASDIERERMAWMQPFATLLRAGVAVLRGAREDAIAGLERAVRGFRAGELAAHAAAASDRLARLRPVPDLGSGAALATSTLAAEGVVAPERMIATLVPWGG